MGKFIDFFSMNTVCVKMHDMFALYWFGSILGEYTTKAPSGVVIVLKMI